MSDARLALMLACGERVVCHLVEPSVLAGELPALVELYFAPHRMTSGPLRARISGAEIELDPMLPIGDQVVPDAEIFFPAV
ncbi:MAG: hypothetical protein ACREL6_09510 [Gemmatimonadales bacterium]